MATDVVLLLSTFPDQETARAITRTLVEERLVACGNLLPAVESIYCWKGEIEASLEILGILKTTADRVPELMTRLRTLHPYEVPEMLEIPVTEGWTDYIKWVGESVRPGVGAPRA